MKIFTVVGLWTVTELFKRGDINLTTEKFDGSVFARFLLSSNNDGITRRPYS